ncbi:MAG: molybdopterin-dependent oxidoreductase [Deltaproteobacteria bacterium]|nr:molybdopterin-dependent oxidoreductase [Deltaproteobacteria bacterium]
MREIYQSRRDFLKRSGATVLTLSLSSLARTAGGWLPHASADGERAASYADWEDVYRKQWTWDRVAFGSHLNICWPVGSCLFHVYVRNGIVWREEQAARTTACAPDYPDYNPMGCQKGAAFNNNLYGDERLKFPLKRTGRRGEGRWERIGWDQATTEIADAILDGHLAGGTDTFVLDAPHHHCGSIGWAGAMRLNYLLDGVQPDVNVDIGDVYMGALQTFGKMQSGYSADNLLDAELIFMTCSNWSYTYPSGYHFLTEARYNGAEVVVIAPDYNPTMPAADIHVPVRVGADAAFWLGVCHVMISEGLFDRDFVVEQTDLPLLVRDDTGKFLSAADVEEGRGDQFYFFDTGASALRPASRRTLRVEGSPLLEGARTVTLRDGTPVGVRPVFDRLKEMLERDYAPEEASRKSGVPVSLIRELGRKVATRRTCSYIGFTAGKHYHGDLMERSLHLAMALSGNWGKPGTGYAIATTPEEHITYLAAMDRPVKDGGVEDLHGVADDAAVGMRGRDPDSNDEIANLEMNVKATRLMGFVTPSLWLYNHAGYKPLYDNPALADPATGKVYGDYLREALANDWWVKDSLRPVPGNDPHVLMLLNHNPLRRKRSGMKTYPDVLFPKLGMIFALETRMSSSAMYADIVLPCAWYYEKHEMTNGTSGNPFYTYVDRAVPPPGECKEEWAIMALILEKVVERARARGLAEFIDHFGMKHRYAALRDQFTMNGHLETNEDCLKEQIEIFRTVGVLPKDFTYEQFRSEGQVRLHGLSGRALLAAANQFTADRPFYSFRWHVEDKKIFPTHTRRAQFYLDHDWYLEAGEALPVHKEAPPMGGDYPFVITGGHPRVSIHATHLSNAHLSRLHRGQPVVHVNDRDAARLGLADGDFAEIYNDIGESRVMVRTAANIQPGQCVVYFWETYQYKDWKPYDTLLIGLPKALHLAGGYEQFRYYSMNGGPQPATDRGVRVGIRRAADEAPHATGESL